MTQDEKYVFYLKTTKRPVWVRPDDPVPTGCAWKEAVAELLGVRPRPYLLEGLVQGGHDELKYHGQRTEGDEPKTRSTSVPAV